MVLDEQNLVTEEEVTENVEGTTEEIQGSEQVGEQPTAETEQVQEETFTKSQVEEMFKKRFARKEAKIRKEYDRKYGKAEEVVKAGLGVETFEEGVDKLAAFYEENGSYKPQEKPTFTDRDVELLAKGDADEIISLGLEEVIEEVDRLYDIGLDNMTPRERATFQKLATYRQTAERNNALAKIGVKADVYESKEFKDFANQFNANIPITDIYNMYQKTQPKPNIEPIGSMKGTKSEESTVKDFYSYDEAMKFTKKDFDKNPELFKAVEKSMSKWK